MPPNIAAHLDLYTLAAELPKRPYAADEARRQLQGGIRRWLAEQANSGARPVNHQQAIVVSGVSLLVRYNTALTDFFQASGDSCLIVFVLPPNEVSIQPARMLPAYIRFDPESALRFFQSALGVTSIVGATVP